MYVPINFLRPISIDIDAYQLLRPKLLPLLDSSQCATIVRLVKDLIKILGSDAVALDGRHSPALYAKFLSNLLDKYYTPALQEDIRSLQSSTETQPQSDDITSLPFFWPDVPSQEGTPVPLEARPHTPPAVVREEAGDLVMDFSLSHFVQSAIPPAPAAPEAPYWPRPAPAPSTLPGSAYGASIFTPENTQPWPQPFNYASMLDMVYTQYGLEGR